MIRLYKLIAYLETLACYKDDKKLDELLDCLYQEIAKIRFKQVLNRQKLLKENRDNMRELSYIKNEKLKARFLNESETFLDKYGMTEGHFRRMMKDLADIKDGVIKTELLYYKNKTNTLGQKRYKEAKDNLYKAYDYFVLSLSDNQNINKYVYRYLDMYYFFKDRAVDDESKVDYTMFRRYINKKDEIIEREAIKYIKANRQVFRDNAKIIPFKHVEK